MYKGHNSNNETGCLLQPCPRCSGARAGWPPVPGHFCGDHVTPSPFQVTFFRESPGGSPTSSTTRPWTHPTDVPHRLASHHDMSTHRPKQDYRLYPAFCFQVSPTFNDWVKMTAADVQQLRREPDFMSSKSATRTPPTSLPPLLTHPSSSPHLLLSQSSYPIHTPRRDRRSNQRYQSKIRHPHPRRRQRRHHRSQDQAVRSGPAKSPGHLVQNPGRQSEHPQPPRTIRHHRGRQACRHWYRYQGQRYRLRVPGLQAAGSEEDMDCIYHQPRGQFLDRSCPLQEPGLGQEVASQQIRRRTDQEGTEGGAKKIARV